MALKDVNILEKHAEKMVLGAAAAGALFMGYLATQKITTENDIAPKEVQASIQKKVFGDPELNQTPENPAPGTLLYSQKEIEKLNEPKVQVPDYVARFNAEARDRPLPQAVVTTLVPQMGPANMAPGAKTGVEDNANWALAAPEPVPGVEMLHVEAREIDVAENPLAPGVTLPAGTVLNVKGKKAVVIEGYIPVGDMTLQMLNVKDVNRRIPADRNHAVIQNIHVQRAELKPGGGQTAWEDVKPAKTSATPPQIPAWDKIDDVVPAMNTIDQQFKEIVLPDFHQDAQGVPIPPAILTKPLPDKIQKKIDDLHAAIEAAKIGPGITAAGRGGPATPVVTPVRATITDAQSVKMLEVVPFTVWDENVEAGHRYRYRVSVEYVNPVFGWGWGLAKPAQKTQGVLASEAVVSDPVKVDSDVEFFVMNAGFGGKDAASIRIFKKIGGKWYKNELSTLVGTRIAGKVPRPDETPIQYVPVETPYTIVDVVQANGEVRVVLRDADGSLTTRDSVTDRNSPDMKRLTEESTTRPATQPDTQPGVVTTPPTRGGTPPVPTTGRSTPIPTGNPPRRGN